MLWFREDLLEEAGLEGPPKDWDELVEYAEKLTVKDDDGNVIRYGLAMPGARSEHTSVVLLSLYWQGEDEFVTDDNMPAFNNQTSVDAFEMFAKIYENDWMMPEVDGPEVARRLREAGDNVPVLMLTARDAVEDRVVGLDSGTDDPQGFPFILESAGVAMSTPPAISSCMADAAPSDGTQRIASGSMPSALFMAMRALVLAGLPTTSTLTSRLAWAASALPWGPKIAPFALSRSLRSTPGPRGRAPTSMA